MITSVRQKSSGSFSNPPIRSLAHSLTHPINSLSAGKTNTHNAAAALLPLTSSGSANKARAPADSLAMQTRRTRQLNKLPIRFGRSKPVHHFSQAQRYSGRMKNCYVPKPKAGCKLKAFNSVRCWLLLNAKSKP